MMLHLHYACFVVCDSVPKQSWFEFFLAMGYLTMVQTGKQLNSFDFYPAHHMNMQYRHNDNRFQL